MKKIPLGNRDGIKRYALVDNEDFERVSQFKWHSLKESWGTRYAVRVEVTNGARETILMHKFILGVGKGQMVEHRGVRSGLDNQRKNLRLCTPSQNQAGRKIGENNTTGYKGVIWRKDKGFYYAQIYQDGERFYLGSHDDPKDAAKAYNDAAIALYGEFAFINKI